MPQVLQSATDIEYKCVCCGGCSACGGTGRGNRECRGMLTADMDSYELVELGLAGWSHERGVIPFDAVCADEWEWDYEESGRRRFLRPALERYIKDGECWRWTG